MAVLSHARSIVQDWTGRRVTVMGLGRHGGGLGVARFLATRGAKVTVSDAADRAVLADSIVALADLPIHAIHPGGHDERDFSSADVVVVNPAVRPGHPCLAAARRGGAIVTSEIELLVERMPAHVIGITGSNGKSTTVTMIAEILRASGRRTWLGGNLGGSLLGEVESMTADDWVVLELSSFQLAHLSERCRLPELAVVTNCTPNHLDWHGTWDDYAAAKRRLAMNAGTRAILNPLDPVVSAWSGSAEADRLRERVAVWFHLLPELAVPGGHNRQNAAGAAAAAEAAGVEPEAIASALQGFRGLPHRIELVAEIGGVRYYNDSKSTSPGATIAALEALPGRVWLMAGGVSKQSPLDDWAHCVANRAAGCALFGAARFELGEALRQAGPDLTVGVHETMEESLDWCRRQARDGDVVLLSPGCASFDQFRDFEHRGEAFCRLVAPHVEF